MIDNLHGCIDGHEFDISKKRPDGRSYFLTFKDRTPKDEQLEIDLYKVINDDSNELIDLWYKRGHIKTKLASYWNITVYATDHNGFTWGRYNPQIKQGTKLNFKWIQEGTKENLEQLLREVVRLAYEE